jgi:hypothetical protein
MTPVLKGIRLTDTDLIRQLPWIAVLTGYGSRKPREGGHIDPPLRRYPLIRLEMARPAYGFRCLESNRQVPSGPIAGQQYSYAGWQLKVWHVSDFLHPPDDWVRDVAAFPLVKDRRKNDARISAQ